MFYRAQLKEKTKQTMQGNWSQILLTVGLMAVIYISLSIVSARTEDFNLGDLLLLLLEGPVLISFSVFMLHLLHHGTVTINEFFEPFSNFVKWMLAGLWQTLWIVLWLFVFIVPGFIKSFSYSQYYFILADNPDADLRQALKTSIKMTKGYKGELFVAYLSFMNWFIAALAIYFLFFMFLPGDIAFIFGMIGMGFVCLYLVPYMTGTFAEIYLYLKEQALANGVCTYDEFGIENPSLTITETKYNENENKNYANNGLTNIESMQEMDKRINSEDVNKLSLSKDQSE